MKEQVQELGVRKWFGDDFINMQTELLDAITGAFAGYGCFVFSGAETTVNQDGTVNISAGLAYLISEDGIGKIVRIEPVSNMQDGDFFWRFGSRTYTRQYKDSQVKNIIVEYYAIRDAEGSQTGKHLFYSQGQTDVHPRFREAIQDASHRFATDSQIANWNGKLNASQYTALDILAKLLTVDGTGTGLDADKIDGLHIRINSGYFQYSTDGATWTSVSMTANDLLTLIKTVDGSASGLDADTTDGLHVRINGGYFQYSTNGTTWTSVSMTASDILTAIKTVDGSSSGLDADLLDGMHAATANTPSTVVNRDASGDFAAGTLTVTDIIIA